MKTLPALSFLGLRYSLGLQCLLLAGLLSGAVTTGCGDHVSPTSAPPATVPPPTATDVSPSATPLLTVAPTEEPDPTHVPSPTTVPLLATSAAPDFQIKLFQGGDVLGSDELRLSDVTGRPLVLNFWARFCGPCWSEMPELQDFYEEYADEVQLLGVDLGQFTGLGLPKDASKLLDALGITYPAGYTDDAQVVRDYRVRAMPTTIFITAEGEVFRSWTGSIEREQLETIIAEMLEGE